ncbi:lipopolysaccharide biosynthesis protein [uncultured Aquabacterium sp.]|uniref:lipopolysaccharide biosynthesis protein n=1 Tax=uncultured Aquabacterium sp. TaxID=158753 RepID=UPI0030D2C8EB
MAGAFTRVGALRAAAAMTLSTYVTVALGLVVSAILARSLGPDDYGRYAYLLWLVGLLVTIGNHGFPISATRHISELKGAGQDTEAASLYSWLKKWQWTSLLAIAVIFAVCMPFVEPIGWSGHSLLFTALCILCFVPKAFFFFHTSVAKGHGAFWIEASGNMLMSILYTIGVAVLAWSQASLMANLWWFAAISVAHLLTMVVMLRKSEIRGSSIPLPPDLRARVQVHMRWTSLQVFVAALSNRTVETYLLGRLIGPAEVGYFAIATNLVRGGIELVSSSLTTILMPSLAHARGAGGVTQVNAIMQDTLRYFAVLGGLTAGLGWLLAEPGVDLLYGHRYGTVAHAVQVMSVISGFFLIEAPFSSVLATLDDHRFKTGLSVLYFGLSAAFALLLVPEHGIMGAIAANGLTRTVTFLLCAVWVKRRLGLVIPWMDAGRALISVAGAMALASGLIYLVGGMLAHWLAGLVYVIGFICMTLLTGLWRPKDIHLLIKLTQRFPAVAKLLAPILSRMPQVADPSQRS